MLIQADLSGGRRSLREVVAAGEPLNPEVIEQVRAGVGPHHPRRLRPDRDDRAGRQHPGLAGQARLDGPARCPATGRAARPGQRAARPTRARSASTCRPGRSALMTGYHGDAERNAEAMRGGYYHTGDVAARDADGYITYVGRSRRRLQGLRLPDQPVRAGERADRARGGRRGRRRAGARPGAAGRAEGVRRARRRAASRRRRRPLLDPALRAGAPGAVQAGPPASSSPSCPRRSPARSAASSCASARRSSPRRVARRRSSATRTSRSCGADGLGETDAVSGPVVVVGAGPVGLTAALLLARRGLDGGGARAASRALSAAPGGAPGRRGVPRAPGRRGRRRAPRRAPARWPASGCSTARHRVLAEFRRRRRRRACTAGRRARSCTSPTWRRCWRRGRRPTPGDHRAARRRGDRPRPGRRRRDADRRDRDGGADRSVRAAAVLGCDGANSTVRGLIGASMRDLGPADRWLVLDVRSAVPLPVWPGAHQVCDARRPATFMPVTGDRYRWECRMRAGGDGRGPDDAGAAARGCSRPSTRRGRGSCAPSSTRSGRRWPTAGGPGGCCWPGTPPTSARRSSARGWGSGLRDVHQLAWKLAAVLAGEADDDLLDTYQAEREPHARALIRVALLLGRLMTGGGRGGDVVRRGVLAAVRRIPAVARLATDSRTPPLRRGPLVERRGRAGRRLAGHAGAAAGGARRRAALPAGRRPRGGRRRC